VKNNSRLRWAQKRRRRGIGTPSHGLSEWTTTPHGRAERSSASLASVSRASAPLPLRLGRYALHDEIASGGMASVHFGRLLAVEGFARTVAIKRLHAQNARDPDFATMFLDEARLAARIRHPNVISIVDVVALDGELFLVMDYVHGESLSRLARRTHEDGERVDVSVLSAVVCGALRGLHAAHQAAGADGAPLHLVHRDVSPENILVGADGVARVLDFGVAKAAGRMQATRDGKVKGKLAYMSPEQLRGDRLDRRSDIYAVGIVLWEMLTGRALFAGENEGETVVNALERKAPLPSSLVASVPLAMDAVVLRALERNPTKRFSTANEMAAALEAAVTMASPRQVAEWVEVAAGDILAKRARRLEEIERALPDENASVLAAASESLKGRSDVSTIAVTTRPQETSRNRALLVGALFLVGGAVLFRLAPRGSSAAPAGAGSPTSNAAAPSSAATATTLPVGAPRVVVDADVSATPSSTTSTAAPLIRRPHVSGGATGRPASIHPADPGSYQ
jgi:serine/threonine protein kinase